MKRVLATAVIFAASMFTAYATIYDASYTAEGKAKFANDLARFVREGFQEKHFTKALYEKLRNCFSHIAHYNQAGFYATWFADPIKQYDWIQHVMRRIPVGSPEFTHSDVEEAFIRWLHSEHELVGKIRIAAYEESNKNAMEAVRSALAFLPSDLRQKLFDEFAE